METLSSLLKARLRAALPDFDAHVQPVADARFGDYQTNAAMVLAKQQRANPRQLAAEIVGKLDVAEMCEAPEIAGAGFINFRFKPAWLSARFAQLAADPQLGVPRPEKVKTLVVDFSSPNVAKPMHVGHIRSTILGDAIARIAEFVGHRTVRDNHIGDWGKQFGMLIVGWKRRVAETGQPPDSIEQLAQIYKAINAQIEREAAARIVAASDEGTGGESAAPMRIAAQISEELVKLQSGDQENLRLWQEMIRISQAEFDAVYGQLGVRFDVTLGESFYNPQLKSIVDELGTRGIASESEGAICVFSDGNLAPEQDPFLIKDKEGWRPNPALVQKSDGTANYTTTDLATLRHRLETWHPDEIAYVTDGRQQLHFRQLFAIFRRWWPEMPTRLAHVWFGSILGDDGKPFKTRSGETIRLADLLDEAEERAAKIIAEKNPALSVGERREIARVIGLGAVKYADLLPNRQSDYIFSWDKMLALQGNTAPYLQYSYVRIRSIFRRAAEEESRDEERGTRAGEEGAPSAGSQALDPRPSTLDFPPPAFDATQELAVVKKLLQFGEVVPQVLEDYRPNILCNYLFELAQLFHSFFEACTVLKAAPAVRESRLQLCDATARVLARGLGLLGIGVPEKM